MDAYEGKRWRLWIALALTVAACAQPGLERVVERRASDDTAPRGDALLRRMMLETQNAARAQVGSPPLVWDDGLAADALDYAKDMARTGRFAHARIPQLVGDEGENLWMGTRDAYALSEMAGHWLAERRDFVDRPVPMSSRTGRFEDVGHYAQIVWRGTTRMGCALASSAASDYLVCRYLPAGNVVGRLAY